MDIKDQKLYPYRICLQIPLINYLPILSPALKVIRHTATIEVITDQYKLVAADANNSGQQGSLLKSCQETLTGAVNIADIFCDGVSDAINAVIEFPDVSSLGALTLKISYPAELISFKELVSNYPDFAPVVGQEDGIIRLAWADMTGNQPIRRVS